MFKDECGPSSGAGCRGVAPSTLATWPTFVVLVAPNVAGTDTEAVLGILPCFVMSHYVSLIASLTSGNLH